jgi:hypothetical protein
VFKLLLLGPLLTPPDAALLTAPSCGSVWPPELLELLEV